MIGTVGQHPVVRQQRVAMSAGAAGLLPTPMVRVRRPSIARSCHDGGFGGGGARSGGGGRAGRRYRPGRLDHFLRSEEHTSELQSLMRISYAVFCLKKNT